MRKIDQLLTEYGESHQNATNKAIHWICVPLIFFSVIGLIASIPSGMVQSVLGPRPVTMPVSFSRKAPCMSSPFSRTAAAAHSARFRNSAGSYTNGLVADLRGEQQDQVIRAPGFSPATGWLGGVPFLKYTLHGDDSVSKMASRASFPASARGL